MSSYSDLLRIAQENARNATKKQIPCYQTLRPVNSLNKGPVSNGQLRKKGCTKFKQKCLSSRTRKGNLIKGCLPDDWGCRMDRGRFTVSDPEDSFVSAHATAIHEKLVEKYESMLVESVPETKREVKNLQLTKDRVRQALQNPKPVKRDPKPKPNRNLRNLRNSTPIKRTETRKPTKKSTKAPPGPIDFNSLLKIAEELQFKPILFKPQKPEPQRLMTSAQKSEFSKEKSRRTRILSEQGHSIKDIDSIIVNDVMYAPLTKKPKLTDSVLPSKALPCVNIKEENFEPMTIKSEPLTINCEPPTIKHEPPTIKREPQTIKHEPPTIKREPPTINHEPLTIKREPPTIKLERPTVKRSIPQPTEHVLKKIKTEVIDPEFDDFIDDSEDSFDYSAEIRKMFRYDPNKFAHLGDEECTVSSVAQQFKEERISAKLGLEEDLRDMELERLEKMEKLKKASRMKINY